MTSCVRYRLSLEDQTTVILRPYPEADSTFWDTTYPAYRFYIFRDRSLLIYCLSFRLSLHTFLFILIPMA